jgi:signal transduction histidine kinase
MPESSDANQYQNLLHQLAIASHHHWDLDRLLPMAIAETARALQVKRGSILRLKYPETAGGQNSIETIQVTAIAEWVDGQAEFKPLLNRQFALSDCRWCQEAFANAPEPLAIADKRDVSLAAASGKKKAAILDEPNLPALLIVPLWRAGEAANQNQVLGFLVLQHHLPHPWQPEELALIDWVAIQVSTAIVQSQTLQQVQTEVEDRTSQLQSSLELQEKLYEKMRQQVAELKHLYEVKNQFVSDMSDRLKHPLTAMRIAIRLLRQPELPVEKRNQYLDIIDRQCTEEINLIEDLLSLQRLDSKPMASEWQNIDFKQAILDVTKSFEQKWRDRGLSLAVELPPSSVGLQTDLNSLNRILLELLTNAGKYSDPNTTVYLRLIQQPRSAATKLKEISNSDFEGHGSQAVLTIRNTGFCISEAELPHIFDRFVRSQAVIQPVRGTGLGLALVKSLVEYLHGQIDVSSSAIASSQSCETCFTLTLPQFIESYRS